MKKLFIVFLCLTVLLSCVLVGCGNNNNDKSSGYASTDNCIHDWDFATCTSPKTCKLCGKVDGVALGHDWRSATSTEPKTCKRCGETEGSPIATTYSVGDYPLYEKEFNDSFGTANLITVSGTTVYASINKSTDADYFKFTLLPGETVIVVCMFDYDIDTQGSISGIFNSSEKAVSASKYSSSTETMGVSYENTSSYSQTFYYFITFRREYTYKNTVGNYTLYVTFSYI